MQRRPPAPLAITDIEAKAAPADEDSRRDFVGSFARGLSVIKAFDRDSPSMRLATVAKKTGMTRAAARRFLLTLEQLGYVRAVDRNFSLTPKMLELGYAYLGSFDLPEIATPFMEEIVRHAEESCSASVLDDEAIVYVARIPTSRIMSVSLGVGARLPAVSTSMGRVLLSDLDDAALQDFLSRAKRLRHTEQTVVDPDSLFRLIKDARRDGYALVDQELEMGLRSIAVPIRNRRGTMLAAMNVSAHASRVVKRDMTRRFLPLLQSAAARIQTLLS